jgi:hypothetical protein
MGHIRARGVDLPGALDPMDAASRLDSPWMTECVASRQRTLLRSKEWQQLAAAGRQRPGGHAGQPSGALP